MQRLVDLVAGTGAHGVKLDFIERFALVEPHRTSIEAAAVTLLREVRARLDEVAPGVSIEFREPYNGPVATSLATMIRVNDCPMSPVRNRVGILDLRLATRGVAVHADPIMWAPGDSADRAAQHLVNALFGVPQVSVDLLVLPTEHRATLRFWIGFHNHYRRVLLHGELSAARPDLNYSVVTARHMATVVTARYVAVPVVVPCGDWNEWLIANTEPEAVQLVDEHHIGAVDLLVRDSTGEIVSSERLDRVPASILIPVGGLAEVRRA